jgi:glyoxylate/hydroxypyruvate reductase A
VKLVVTSPLQPELLDRLRAVDPRVEVVVPPDLPAPTHPSDHPQPSADTPEARKRWERLLDEAEILFDFGPPELVSTLARRPHLRWIQGSSAGVGRRLEGTGLLESYVVITTSSGVHARPLAEFALLGILMFGKRTLELVRAQEARHWERHSGEEVRGKTVCVVGLGSIGLEVARVVRTLDARVVGTVRALRGRTAAALDVDRLEPTEGLDELLPEADVVVIATPDTPETTGLLDARRIAAMKEGAVLVNVGRGGVVDEDALIEALRSGRLAGAALDVFRQEPLPADSPLWSLPNVFVSPHTAANVAEENARIVDIFCDNVRRYLAGEPLRNVLDPALLY